jgi:putative ABC transport system substrate-binding protein
MKRTSLPLRRRTFITGLGIAAAWPVVARAQQPAATPVVGFLGTGSPDVFAYIVRAFRQGLSETGFVEGRNVAIEYSWANDQLDRLPALAANLVRRQMNLIVANSTPASLAAKDATTTIPVVFQIGSDPVQSGLVASLNRPGGNLTGVTSLAGELGPKRLELLHELMPAATNIAVLLNPNTGPIGESLRDVGIGGISSDLQAAARTLGVQLHVLLASAERDFDTVFATLARLRPGALLINPSLLFNTRSEQLATLTVRHAVPAIFQFREFAMAGGLMSYGGSITDNYRLLGTYAGRILKGEKPADLPVVQSTRIELIINLKTAKALGLEVPQSILLRADQVIE